MAHEQGRDRADIGIQPGHDAPLNTAQVRFGCGYIFALPKNSVTLIDTPAKIASSIAGSPSFVPGILMNRFGLAAFAWSVFAAARVLAVSWPEGARPQGRPSRQCRSSRK